MRLFFYNFLILLFTLLISCISFKEEYEDLALNYYSLGLYYDDLGKDREAIEFYKKAIELSKGLSYNRANYNLILAYIELKDFETAEKLVNDLNSKDKDNIYILNLKAYLSLSKGDLNLALLNYEEVLKLSPANKDALFNTFYIYYFKKDFKSAKIYLDKYISYGYEIKEDLKEIISKKISF